MSQQYRLHGLTLQVIGDRPELRQCLRRTLHYKGVEATSSPQAADITLDFRVDRKGDALPGSATQVDTDDRFGIGIWKTESRMILRRDETTVQLHPERGTAEAAVGGDLLGGRTDRPARSVLPYLAVLSLTILLRARGWFPLHAAGLARGGRGAVLPAQSGSGKSTAALSLVRSGWDYLSDDTLLLRPESGRIRAYSFRRNFCVDPGAAAHFPELEKKEWPPSFSDSSKWEVDVNQVYPGQSVSTCTPRLVVLPEISGATESSIEPVGTKSALEELISHGAFFLASGPGVADRHLDALRELIAQCRTYRLHAGLDVLEEPGTLHRLLAPLLDEDPKQWDPAADGT